MPELTYQDYLAYNTANTWPTTAAYCTNPVTNAEIWTSWSSTNYTTITVDQTWTGWVTFANGRRRRVQSAEDLRAEDLRGWVQELRPPDEAELARAENRREALRQRAEAATRAMELLRSCLSVEQQAQLDENGCFRVTAPSGRVYTITQGYAGNVYSQGWSYCIHMRSDLPEADHMLAQKLMIETDEAAFLRIANATPSRSALAA